VKEKNQGHFVDVEWRRRWSWQGCPYSVRGRPFTLTSSGPKRLRTPPFEPLTFFRLYLLRIQLLALLVLLFKGQKNQRIYLN